MSEVGYMAHRQKMLHTPALKGGKGAEELQSGRKKDRKLVVQVGVGVLQ